jgi:sulfur-oxidizing protein SoxY
VNNLKRRTFLKGTVASGAALAAASAGLLTPVSAMAASWPKKAFDGKKISEVLKVLHGSDKAVNSKEVKIRAPIQAENGAVVPFSVKTTLPNPEAINVLVNANVQPLVANVNLPSAGGFFSARIKMAKTSDVQVVVKSGGKLYTSKAKIKVTVGGCGG